MKLAILKIYLKSFSGHLLGLTLNEYELDVLSSISMTDKTNSPLSGVITSVSEPNVDDALRTFAICSSDNSNSNSVSGMSISRVGLVRIDSSDKKYSID